MDRENGIVLQVIKYLVESDALREEGEERKGGCVVEEEESKRECEQDGEEDEDEDDEGDGGGDGDGEDEGEHAEAEAKGNGEAVSQAQPQGIEKAQGPAETRQEIPDRILEINLGATSSTL